MHVRIVFSVIMICLFMFSMIIAGCLSDVSPGREMPPSMTSTSGNQTPEFAPGDTAIVSSPEGILEITVRAFNPMTGELHIEEKNIGTEAFRYNPTLWLQDEDGIRYTTVYCGADRCPGYVFLTTLLPQDTEKRNFENIYDTFRVPEGNREGKFLVFWSYYGQEVSWVLILG